MDARVPERISFKITQAEYAELVALNQPGAGVSIQMDLAKGISIIETRSTEQLVNEWWQMVGDKYGIVWNTAKLDPSDPPLGFTAEKGKAPHPRPITQHG